MSARQMALEALKKCLEELGAEHDGVDFKSECTACHAARQARKAIAALESDIAQVVEPVACLIPILPQVADCKVNGKFYQFHYGVHHKAEILFFAAPQEPSAPVNAELLEALKQIVMNDPYKQSSAGRVARAAITKAGGAA